MNFDTRKYVIIVFILTVGIIYTIRLFFMQVIDDTWTLRATEVSERRKQIVPPRGAIFDRFGTKVVSNRTYYNLMFVEDDIKHLDTAAFEKLLGWEKGDVKKRFKEIVIEQRTYRDKNDGYKVKPNYQSDRPYAFIKEMTLDEIAKIAPNLYKFPGFYEEITSMRSYTYPNGANIFGYITEVNEKEIEEDSYYRKGDNIGRAGIEKFYEKELRGQKGIKYIVTSARNNELKPYMGGKYDTIAKQGPNFRLGIDIKLQEYGEKLMQGKRGCIVAIEPSTGEILALVSSPTYDPNLLIGNRNIKKNYPKLILDKDMPLFPRPLAAEYPPGSIFKLLQSLIALQEGVITPESGFPCNKGLVGCHPGHTANNLPDAIKFSCNPYFYAVVRRILQQGKSKNVFADAEIGMNKWYDYMMAFGLGQKFDSDVTGLRPGLIPNSAYYNKWYGYHRWAFSTIRSNSIGQGEIKLTPLQMANVACIIANRGWYYTPHFVKSIGGKGSLPQFRKKHKCKIDRKNYDPVVEGMRRAVNEPGGTASRAKINNEQKIIVCGKTGTAQNPHGEDHAVFISFAPMDQPKIAIAVFIENAGFGGTWSAPVASLMMEKYLTRKVKDKEKEKRILEATFKN
ncbi:MAG: penicillin-binding protein 2 [Flavobacteriia bacterium]|nr:penicillin-binding protein 2 [Flavobacteriia bacterium]